MSKKKKLKKGVAFYNVYLTESYDNFVNDEHEAQILKCDVFGTKKEAKKYMKKLIKRDIYDAEQDHYVVYKYYKKYEGSDDAKMILITNENTEHRYLFYRISKDVII